MMKPVKIVVAGMGGVGGYFGGLLARTYTSSPEASIWFLARGEHLTCIQEEGLQVTYDNGSFTARPQRATNNATEVGPADYILVCTKSYDLPGIMEQLRPCITPATCIIPLLNGVESPERIAGWFPEATVCGGCVYVVAQLSGPGQMTKKGAIERIFFGLDGKQSPELHRLENLCRQAGMDAHASDTITAVMWEKFHLVGANSTATSYHNCTTAELLADAEKSSMLFALLQEVNHVAQAKGITFREDIVEATTAKLRAMPAGTTSSMHRDFQKPGGRTELETVTGYMVREGHAWGVPIPAFEQAYAVLKDREPLPLVG